jgi:hypothetical protein
MEIFAMQSNINENQAHLDHINNHVCISKCISWTAVFTGALVGVAFSFLLNLLSLGIGISAFPATKEGQLVFAVSGFIVLTIFAILAMFPAGYVAGKLASPVCLKRKTGELHGLVAWTVAIIISVLLGSSLEKFVSQTAYVVTRQPVEVRLLDITTDNTTRLVHADYNALPKVVIAPDKAADAAAMATFATFFIFFIGMLAACFGGRCAMMCRMNELEHCHHCNKKECK